MGKFLIRIYLNIFKIIQSLRFYEIYMTVGSIAANLVIKSKVGRVNDRIKCSLKVSEQI